MFPICFCREGFGAWSVRTLACFLPRLLLEGEAFTHGHFAPVSVKSSVSFLKLVCL